jgi:hypothetical protein
MLVPETADGFGATYGSLLSLGEDWCVRLLLKFGQENARSWDHGDGIRTVHRCAGRHATPITAMGTGGREAPFPYTTLHRVGSVRSWHCDSALCDRTLRSADENGDVQHFSETSAMQTVPALRAQFNYSCAPMCVACRNAQASGKCAIPKQKLESCSCGGNHTANYGGSVNWK